MAFIVNTQGLYVNTLEYTSYLMGSLLIYYELMIIVYTVTMQDGDNMSVMTIAISWGNKME